MTTMEGPRRLTYSSLLLEVRRIGGRYPVQSSRGDEHLCARCEAREGTESDREGRLVCKGCAK